MLLISFNLFSFFSHQEAKRTASFLMNLSQDRKVSFIFISITHGFHFGLGASRAVSLALLVPDSLWLPFLGHSVYFHMKKTLMLWYSLEATTS